MPLLPAHLTAKPVKAAELEADEMFIGSDERHYEIIEIDEPEPDGKRYVRFREVGTVRVQQGRVPVDRVVPRIHRVL